MQVLKKFAAQQWQACNPPVNPGAYNFNFFLLDPRSSNALSFDIYFSTFYIFI